MGFLARVSLFWALVSLFLLMIVIKLDGSAGKDWSWYVIFVPVWFYDAFAVLFLSLSLFCRSRRPNTSYFNYFTNNRKVWLLFLFALKILFSLMLCAKLDGLLKVSYVFIFIPLWLLLLMLTGDAYFVTWCEAVKTHVS